MTQLHEGVLWWYEWCDAYLQDAQCNICEAWYAG